jgi:hypothetical protein
MNVSAPSPISAPQRPPDAAEVLRLNQRFSAEILQISGEHVVLAVDGVRIVAQLTSAEQAAALAERRFAQFVVRQPAGETGQPAVLQLLRAAAQPSTAAAAGPALAQSLLQAAGLPLSEANRLIAQALLTYGLPVTAGLAADLQRLLDGRKRWGEAEANLAAALKAAGLPLSEGALELALDGLEGGVRRSLPDLLAALRKELQRSLERPSSRAAPALLEAMRQALEELEAMLPGWREDPAELANELRKALAALGRPLEAALAEDARRLPALGRLRSALAQADPAAYRPELAQALDRAQDGLRLVQFLNSPPETDPPRGHWLRLELPLQLQQPGAHPAAAHLRIAYLPDSHPPRIDPANTRIVLRVDLDESRAVQVDLSLTMRRPSGGEAAPRLALEVTASDAALGQAAEAALPGLCAGLESLGYAVHSAECQVGWLRPAGQPHDDPANEFNGLHSGLTPGARAVSAQV